MVLTCVEESHRPEQVSENLSLYQGGNTKVIWYIIKVFFHVQYVNFLYFVLSNEHL